MGRPINQQFWHNQDQSMSALTKMIKKITKNNVSKFFLQFILLIDIFIQSIE